MPYVYSGDGSAAPTQTASPDPRIGLGYTPSLERPDTGETFRAAFRQGNIVASALSQQSGAAEPVEGYNPLDDIQGTSYFDNHAHLFFGSRSPAETDAIKRQIDREENDKRTLASSGVLGTLATFSAGMLDPTMLLPGRVAVTAVKEGSGLARGAFEVGGAMAVQATAQEMGLQATQETRPLSESVLNVGSATILGALIGGPAMAFLSRAEREALTGRLNHERAELDAHVRGEALPEGFEAFHGSPRDFETFSNAAHHGQAVELYFTNREETARKFLGDNGEGNVYRVHIRADRNRLLDLDKSIASQPDAVKDRLRALGENVEASPAHIEEERLRSNLEAATARKIAAQDNYRANPQEFAAAEAAENEAARAWQAFERPDRLPTGQDILDKYGHQRLADAGIPGMVSKYDEGLRYSILDPNLVAVTHKNGEAILKPVATGFAQPAGAAATDTRTLQPVRTGVGLERVPWDPVMGALNQPSIAGRRAMADLAEVATLVGENLRGETTTLGGQMPLETMRRLIDGQTAVAVGDKLQQLWGDMRFEGGRIPFGRRMTIALGLPERGGSEAAPSFEQFKTMVSDAMMNGDKHTVPQIEEAAKFIRARVFEPWAERAEKVFPDFERREGEIYFPHVWNKALIQARRPEFVNKLVDLYTADQTTKRQAQDRLRAFQGALDNHEATIQKLTDKLERRRAALDEDEALRDEVSKFNKYAFQRATALREGEFRNVGGIAVPVPGKNIEKARGGASFETKARGRINELADRVSAYVHEIEDLENRIQAEFLSANAVRERIENEILAWQGGSSKEAKSAIKAREKYEAERAAKAAAAGKEKPTERLKSADAAVDKAVKRILESDRDRDVEDLRSYANETVDRILGSPDGRLAYEEHQGAPAFGPQPVSDAARGSLARRTLDVSNEFARDWIERDIEQVVRDHQRTFVPDVLLAERFGDVEMSEQMRAINEEYARLIDQTKAEADRTKLGKQREGTIETLAAIRDRFRGLYNIPTTAAARRLGRVSAAVRNANVPLSLGMAAVSSIPDAAGAVLRWGMSAAFSDGWMPFVRSLMTNRELSRETLRQFRTMGIAIDTFTAQRHHEFSGLAEPYRPGSRVERVLQWGADKFNIANMLGPWTDLTKSISSAVAAQELYRAAKASAEGKATARQLRALGENNITPNMATRIAEQYEKSGNKIDNVMLPNTEAWTDDIARETFEGALSREANIAVMTPGLDKPLLFSDPIASVLLQFKSFTAGATTRIMVANLQRADAETLQGLVASLAMGMLSYKVNSITGGQPTSDRPQDWIKEAMSRGNIFGWLEEGNALASKVTRGGLDVYRLIGADKPLSKFASQSAPEQLMGPTFGKMQAITKATSAAAARDWTESDTKALRRIIPMQNLFYLRGLFNAVEQGANHAFGIQPAQTRH